MRLTPLRLAQCFRAGIYNPADRLFLSLFEYQFLGNQTGNDSQILAICGVSEVEIIGSGK
jgi:hypothetical protein